MALINFTGCEQCGLKKEWPHLTTPKMQLAYPRNPSPYRVMVVGEGPGKQEDEKGIPFVGDSGQYLRNEIPREWKNSLYWTNTVRCRPPRNRTPQIDEIKCCSSFLKSDLNAIHPHAILAVGDPALKSFWDSAWITGMRGIPFPSKLSDGTTTWVYSSYHPSYVMRNERVDYDTKETVNTLLPIFKTDLKKFFDSVPYFAEHPPKIYSPPDEIFYPKTKEEAIALFHRLSEFAAVDFETFKLKPYMRDARLVTAGFSDGNTTFAFPVNWPGGICPWGEEALIYMLNARKRFIAQHANFETIWAWYITKNHDRIFDDVEVQARLRHKRKGIGSLDDLSRIYLGIDIKRLVDESMVNFDKNRILEYSIEKVLKYNAIDAWSEALIFTIIPQYLEDEDFENYDRIIAAIKSTAAMEIHGLPVDLNESAKLQKDLYVKLRDFENEARKIKEVQDFEREEKRIFRISENETVGTVIVSYCGLQLPKTDGSAKEGAKQVYSTAEDTLAPLAGQHELIDIILDYREVGKLLSTYVQLILSGALLGKDGLLHPNYTVVRVATYRLSSELPNIQNFPKRKNKQVRRQIIAPPGYILLACDYGQLEGRVICIFSRDPGLRLAMIEQAKAIAAGDAALIEKWDIHYKWLYRILDIYPPYLDRLAKVSGETKEEKIIKAGRTIIKTDFVFASFYGSQPKSISARCNLPIHIANQVLDEFWSEYSEARNWIDNQFNLYDSIGQVSSITGRHRNEHLPGNEIINSPVQGTAAEIVLEAQNALCDMALTTDINLLPRINIHDDLIFMLPDTNDLEQYIKLIGNEIVKPRFPWITVPLMTEARVGYNWCDLESVTNFIGSYYDV